MISDALFLIRTDLMKLGRRRGLMALVGFIAIGGVGVIFTVNAIRHGSNPAQRGPAGGVANFENATDFLAMMGVVVAAIIGSTAGAGDADAGVLRDLIATGRSRAQLFASRALAGLLVTLAIMLAALAVAIICSIVLRGSLPAPSLSYIVQRGAAVLAFAATSVLVAIGIATFARSRGPATAVVIGFGVIVSQLLLRTTFLGDVRAILPLAAFDKMAGNGTQGIHSSLAAAIGVTAAWALAAVAAGSWWSSRMEV